jgi:hypothetical protein
LFYNIRTEIRTLGQGIVVPLNWIGLVDLILPYIHLTDFLVEEKFSWLPSKIKRLWKQFAFSEPHKFSRQITRFNLFLILSFFYNIRTEFRTQHAEEDDPERLQQIIGQVHHMFSRFVKLWIYDFFVLFFYKVEVFYWDEKMPRLLFIITEKDTLPSRKWNIKFCEKNS